MIFDFQKRAYRRFQWRRWFAWRPVSIGPHRYAWLQFVERKGYTWSLWYEQGISWKYREASDAT